MAGRILLDADALVFEGAFRGRLAFRRIAYTAIASSRVGRGPTDRVGGRSALVLELRNGETIRVAMTELGARHELLEALTSRQRTLRRESQRDVPLVDDGAVFG